MNINNIDYEWLVKEVEENIDLGKDVYEVVYVVLKMYEDRAIIDDIVHQRRNNDLIKVLDILSKLSQKIDTKWSETRYHAHNSADMNHGH